MPVTAGVDFAGLRGVTVPPENMSFAGQLGTVDTELVASAANTNGVKLWALSYGVAGGSTSYVIIYDGVSANGSFMAANSQNTVSKGPVTVPAGLTVKMQSFGGYAGLYYEVL